VDPKPYKRSDIKVSPTPGGVGPLTVCALFENLLTASNGLLSK
jgi:5,10-methylene-tetrahydrofolate dehydrogenase/methenyl tetrahydrofolate cyclohydrolase